MMRSSGCKKLANSPVNLSQAVVTTLAGPAIEGSVTGAGPLSSFNHPTGIAVDASGNLYVADQGNNVIRKISPAGVVTTLAGTGQAGSANGISTLATFNQPSGVAVDVAGNLYVLDYGNSLIRIIEHPAGYSGAQFTLVNTLATGLGATTGIGVDTLNNSTTVYASEGVFYQIEDVSPSGLVTVVAGSVPGSNNGVGTAASFDQPQGLAVDASGNVYVADAGNNLIRMIGPFAIVSTFAGYGGAGSNNGAGPLSAAFNHPMGVAVDKAGNVYVADTGNNLIRKISTTGVVTWLAGNGQSGSANGLGYAATFNNPQGVAVDAEGNVYVAIKKKR